MDKFLFIRLSSLGDIIHTLPAFAALRKNFPEARISWLVEENGKNILDFVPGLDKAVAISSKKWPVASKKFWTETFRVIKSFRERDQVALDFQGLMKSGLFTYLSRAKTRIGFHKKNLREPSASIFYTENLESVSEKMHVMEKNLKLLTRIGIQEENLIFPLQIPDEAYRSVLEKIKPLGYNGNHRLFLLNVGAAWETKRWSAECWIDLVQKLKENRKDPFYLQLWGTEVERDLAERIHTETGIPLVPPIDLKEVMALVKRTDLLISGDTFALQVACALNRPVVGIFGPTNPKRNGPFCPKDRVAFHELDCSYCYKRKCSSMECLKKITPEEVLALSFQVLDNHA